MARASSRLTGNEVYPASSSLTLGNSRSSRLFASNTVFSVDRNCHHIVALQTRVPKPVPGSRGRATGPSRPACTWVNKKGRPPDSPGRPTPCNMAAQAVLVLALHRTPPFGSFHARTRHSLHLRGRLLLFCLDDRLHAAPVSTLQTLLIPPVGVAIQEKIALTARAIS